MSVSGARNHADPISTISGPRNLQTITISGARNSENGSAIFLGPETDVMVQFLAPETDIMGERNFMTSLTRKLTYHIKIDI